MATLFYDKDADLNLIKSKKVAMIGYGSQGHAHAQNLRDSGVEVRVAECRPRRQGPGRAGRLHRDRPPAEASAWADVIMVLVPDTDQAKLYEEAIAPNLKPGKTLMFAHGFNIRYGCIKVPAGVDVSMIAPKSPGHRVREVFVEGGGVPALVAVEQDASGKALAQALSYAQGPRPHPRRACCRPPSRKRPRRISSARRPCSAAAPAPSSRRASRPWWKPATSPRSPTSSACTS